MSEIILDISPTDYIRIYIEYLDELYILNYINSQQNYNLIADNRKYNCVHDEYMKIIINFEILRELNEI